MKQHTFPIGAWICDPLFARLSCGGLVDDGRGNMSFNPPAGEIIALLGPKPFPAYKIKYGGSENILLADGVECTQCGAKDDNTHQEYCVASLNGLLRAAKHEPGFGPEPEDVKTYESSISSAT